MGGQKGVSPQEEKLHSYPDPIKPAFLATSLCKLTSGFHFRIRKSFNTMPGSVLWKPTQTEKTNGLKMTRKDEKRGDKRPWNYLQMGFMVQVG